MKGKAILVWFFVLNLVLFVLDTFFIIEGVFAGGNKNWNWGWIIASMQLIYFVFSFKTVGPESKGAIVFFGRPLYEVRSGLVFVPWIICRLRKESRLTIQMQIPGEPEEIDKSGDDTRGLLEGKKFLPIRATTGSYEIVKNNPQFANDPALVEGDSLNQRMTVEPTFLIRFKIIDLVKFIQTIGTIDEARRQLRDTGEAVVQSEFAMRTPSLIIAHRSDVNKKLREEIGKLVKDDPNTPDHDEGWGVAIETAQLLDVDINKGVNEALRDAAQAKILKGKTITDAEAARKKSELEGKGAASARLSMLTAEAAGKQKLADVAKTEEGRFAMQLETAAQTVKEAQYSIVGTDGVAGAIAAAMEVMKKVPGGEKTGEVKKGG